MQVRNSEVFGLFHAEGEKSAYKKLMSVRWPGAISYDLAKLGKTLSTQLEVINDARVSMIKQLVAAGHDPDKLNHLAESATPEERLAAEEDFNEFVSQFNEILDREESLEVSRLKIPASRLPDIEPEVLLAFSKFIEII